MDQSSESVLRERLQTGFLGIIAFALLLFMLVQAKLLLISLAISIILFSLTSDAISAISVWLRVPNWLATTLALFFIALGLFWVSSTIVTQINEVVQISVGYVHRAEGALPEMISWLGPEWQGRMASFITSFNLTGWLRSLAGQASTLVSGTVLISIFVGFMFAERAFFHAKVERLAGDAIQAAQVMRIIDTIMHRVNRYLVVKTFISVVTAGIIWLIYKAAGLGLAGAVALITFVLNYIPSIGTIIATVTGTVLAFVLTGDFSLTLIVGVAISLVQFVLGNIIDPLLLGSTLRLSTLGIVLGLAFWGALWGIAGMFLAVPIMVALMIVCAHIPWLRPVAIMLSREGLPDDGSTDHDRDAEKIGRA